MTDSTGGDGAGEPPKRVSFLIEGRRVRVSDLVDAGVLAPGTPLTFRRKRSGEAHLARVTADGRIELADGRRFRSLSAAAGAASGRGPFDGWIAWALDDGTVLDALRQALLDTMAEQPSAGGLAAKGFAARHIRLKDARRHADEGTPITLTVRDLLGWWDASRRGYLVSGQVSAELDNHGLSTVPDFAAVGLEDRVTLTGPPADTEDEPGTPAERGAAAELGTARDQGAAGGTAPEPADMRMTGAPGSTASDGDEADRTDEADEADEGEEAPVRGQTVGNLPSSLRGVESVASSANFEEAFTKMRLNGYSQLPVLNGPRNLQGAVTWESIALARHTDAEAPFSRAIVKAHAVSYSDHLIDVLPYLEQFGFLLVKDRSNRIAGIITVADVAAEYGATARPFLLIGDLDRQLRRVISKRLDLAEVIALCDPDGRRRLASFDQLSFGDYQQVLSNQRQWDRLGWPLDRKPFTDRLDELREVRNELMHFNDKDKAGDAAVPMLRRMIELLREHGS